jgi:hypothetical protein
VAVVAQGTTCSVALTVVATDPVVVAALVLAVEPLPLWAFCTVCLMACWVAA